MSRPLEASAGARSQLGVARVGSRSVLRECLSIAPLKLLEPENHGHAAWVYQASYGGGFVGRDQVGLDVRVGEGASLFLSSQASSKVYRATQARFELTASVADGGTLICWPDPVVCFDDAALDQRQSFHLFGAASLIVVDAWSAGRVASGERWRLRQLDSRLSLSQDDRPLLVDAQRLSPEHGDLVRRLAQVDGLASILIAGPAFEALSTSLAARWAAAPPGRLDHGCLVVASARDGALLLRLTGPSSEALKACTLELLGSTVANMLGDDPWARKW